MSTQKKEKPILFSGPMVRAILDGTKTQTRRLVKMQPGYAHVMRYCAGDLAARQIGACRWEDVRVPYGKPGDRLWVKETHRFDGLDTKIAIAKRDFESVQYRADEDDKFVTWRPSIYMPRWASRITLEITDVRVELLQDITEIDAMNEGVFADIPNETPWPMMPSDAFCHLWESINGPDSWAQNPWVWVISFKRI